MRRLFTIIVLLMIFAMLGVLVWVSNRLDSFKPPASHSQKPPVEAAPSGENYENQK